MGEVVAGGGVGEGEADDGPQITCDALLNGRVRLRQPKRGYRAGLDAALLAAAVELSPGERALEAGCGPGGALLQVAARSPQAELVGLERDLDAVALASANIADNGLTARVRVIEGDVTTRFSALGLAAFDAAFANPPFFDDEAAIRGPAPERRGAWIADAGLDVWLAFLLKAVREGGRITVIHRADRLDDLLVGLAKGAGSIRVRPIHPFADAPAKRVLVRAVKIGRAPLTLLAPLVLHARGAGGRLTDEAQAILRGHAALGWG